MILIFLNPEFLVFYAKLVIFSWFSQAEVDL